MGSDRQPSDTFEDVDEDMTYQELPSVTPSYDRAPPTIEERLSPFHPSAADRAEVETLPGGRAPRVPTMQGMPVIARDGFAAPVIVGAPEVTGSDGPTNPDGLPAMSASHVLTPPAMDDSDEGHWDQSTDPDGDADPRWNPPPRPHVPSPDAPSIQISKSMEIQVAHLEEGYEPPPDPRVPPVVAAASPRRRAAQAPTEVMLPALKRKKKREGSDWPLIFGLLALILVILALAAVVILGVMGHLGV